MIIVEPIKTKRLGPADGRKCLEQSFSARTVLVTCRIEVSPSGVGLRRVSGDGTGGPVSAQIESVTKPSRRDRGPPRKGARLEVAIGDEVGPQRQV